MSSRFGDFKFTPEQRARAVEALFEYTNIDKRETANTVIDDFERHGLDRNFGFGSLIKSPINAESTKNWTDGIVKDRVARYNAAFRFYGGTFEKPNVMIGLEHEEGGITPGKLTQDEILDENGMPDIDQFIERVRQFKTRESTPGHTIYRLEYMYVYTEGSDEPVIAKGCYTDPSGPLFIGRDAESGLEHPLTIQEQAILIASGYGSQLKQSYQDGRIIALDSSKLVPEEDGVRGPHQRTIFNYHMQMMSARLEHGYPIEDYFRELTKWVNYYREYAPNREFLEAMESGLLNEADPTRLEERYAAAVERNSGNLSAVFTDLRQQELQWHPDVYVTADGPPLSADEYNELLETAREKLRQRLIANAEDRPDLHDKIVPPAADKRSRGGMVSREMIERGVQQYEI